MIKFLPILIVVLSNAFYHIAAKSAPNNINTFASLTVTYSVAAIASLIIFLVSSKGASLVAEVKNLNWTTIVMGITIIGLEAGFLYMYKLGWNITTGQLIASVILALVLILVGVLAFREKLSPSRVAGIVICLVGLYFVNK